MSKNAVEKLALLVASFLMDAVCAVVPPSLYDEEPTQPNYFSVDVDFRNLYMSPARFPPSLLRRQRPHFPLLTLSFHSFLFRGKLLTCL